jgi:hypothetical protein
LNEKLNRRGRGARRGKNGQKLEAPCARKIVSRFFHVSRTAKNHPAFIGRHLRVLSLLSVQPLVFVHGGPGEKKSLTPKRRKEPQTAGIAENAERGRQVYNHSCFSSFGKKLCGLCVLCGKI